jgi:hypothetical protein
MTSGFLKQFPLKFLDHFIAIHRDRGTLKECAHHPGIAGSTSSLGRCDRKISEGIAIEAQKAK